MALSTKKKSKIIADVRAGKLNRTKIAQKWSISRNTLSKIINDSGAIVGENAQKVSKKIEQKATRKIIENESRKLVDYTDKHLSELDTIRTISKYNAQALAKEIKETKNNVSKAEAERIFAVQKVCKITTETLSMIYKDERLAMGLDQGGNNNQDIEDRINKRMKKFK